MTGAFFMQMFFAAIGGGAVYAAALAVWAHDTPGMVGTLIVALMVFFFAYMCKVGEE